MLRAILIAVLIFPVVVAAADGPVAPYNGRPLVEIIEAFREAGSPFAYSTNLVNDDMLATVEPESSDPAGIVRELLHAYHLTVVEDSGVWLIVRDESQGPDPPVDTNTDVVGNIRPTIETIVISASRYEISRDIATSRFSLDQRTIQSMPDIGEDPLRVTQRLPGAAASGASARTHFRGGEESEIGIMLNGQWLFDPYHIRDYQNIFSAIDARAINGVEVYTGGFPARYGDRMSGLVLMESLQLDQPRRNEVGLSVFNTSLLTAGSENKLSWLASARRGNLDLVIDPKFGSPSYSDFFAELAYEFSPDSRLSFNALYADDRVRVVIESDPAELEQVTSSTRNAQFWLQLDNRWSESLTSNTVLSVTSYSNRRNGDLSDPEKMIAVVRDNREVEQFGLRQDWTWRPSDRHLVQWGLQAINGEAGYDYVGSAQYGGLQAVYRDQPESVSRASSARPKGGSYAAYVSDRWKLTPGFLLEWGLRWDDQTYTDLPSDSQLSPRLSLLRELGSNTELRLSWGRYHQSQGIHELQIEDGISNFWPAQRADHLIAGLRRTFSDDISLRIEAFHKDLKHVRPRFENFFDPLGLVPELQADRVRLDPTSGESRGVEISLDGSPGRWNWWTSYTWSKATDRIEGVNEARSWDQRHAFQGGFGWTDEAWSFAAAASVHSGWPSTRLFLVNDEAVPGPRNADRHGTFASLDLRLSRRFNVRKGTLLAFVEVSNATNRRNVCCLDWDITDEDELEFSEDYWMPLLPAIGILWEF
jgi:hypothetical protein